MPDPQFSQSLTERLARLLGADLVAVAECAGPGHMRVAAGCFDGQPLEDFDYENEFSPCREVMRHARPLLLPGGVQRHFPEDAMLRAEDIHSYAGLPLFLPGGGAGGVLHAAWRRDTGPALAARALEAMQPYAGRLAAGLAARRESAALASLARGPGGGGPQAALRWLAAELQAASGARVAVIAGETPEKPGRMRLLACSLDGAPQPLDGDCRLPSLMASELAACPPGRRDALAADLLAAAGVTGTAGAAELRFSRSQALYGRRGILAGCYVLLGQVPLAPPSNALEEAFTAQIRRELRRLSARGLRLKRRQARQQAEKNDSLARLAGGIAHDFNNALAAMQGQAQLALEHFGPDGNCHPARSQVRLLQEGVRASAALLRPLLDYAGDASPPAHGLCDLNAEVQAAAAMPGKGFALPLRLDLSPAPLPLRGDAGELRRLVVALLENASDALPSDPEARAASSAALLTSRVAPDRAAMLNGSLLPPGPCAALELRDTGAGMDRGVLEQAFDPYFSTRPGRRGLGLAAAMGILRRHGGAVAVESAPGQGSCFRLYFPLAETAHPKAPAACIAAGSGPRRILVADDEDTVCRAVAGLLRLKGCAVELAGGHEAALDVLRRGTAISGAVIDMNLSGHCGWETLAGLRAVQPGLRCVMMSGFPVSAAAAGFPEFSGIEVLEKPFCKEQLYRAVLH